MRHAHESFILDTETAELLFTDIEQGRTTRFYYAGRNLFFRTYQETGKKEFFEMALTPAGMFNTAQQLRQLTPEIEELCDLRKPE